MHPEAVNAIAFLLGSEDAVHTLCVEENALPN